MTAPTLAARPADCPCCVLVHCDHCQRDHRHGAQPGHRVAHCRDPASPYRRTGYVLVFRPADKEAATP